MRTTTAIVAGGFVLLLAVTSLVWHSVGREPAMSVAAPTLPAAAEVPAKPALRQGELREIAKLTIVDDTRGLLFPRRVIEEQQLIEPLLTQLKQAEYSGDAGGGPPGYILTFTGLGGTEFRLQYFPGGPSVNLLDMGMNTWWHVPDLDRLMAPLLPDAVAFTPPPDQTSPAQVLLQFAGLVSVGDVQGASSVLAPNLRGIYQYNDYAPLRNTPSMKIVRLEEKTGESGWNPDVGAREQQVAVARVFAMDVQYKVLGLTPSDFKDGEIYHHKATVTQYTAGGPWLISELSGKGP